MEMKSLSYKKLGNTGLGMVFKSVMMVILLSVLSFSAMGQDMIIRSLEAKPFDASASVHRRLDLNKQPCALVKVQLAAPGAAFEGNVIGEVEYKVSEYWVYMSRDTKRIAIKCPNYLPVMVEFSDYGIRGLDGGTTYELVVALPDTGGPKKPVVTSQYVLFEVEPKNSSVEFDGEYLDVADGTAMARKPFGTYFYTISAPMYHPAESSVTVKDPKNKHIVHVALLPAYGYIEIPGTGELGGAKVYIDNEYKGTLPYKSDRLSSGTHNVRIMKNLYAPLQQDVTVTDNETTTFSPTLKADFAEVTLSVGNQAEIWVNDELKGSGIWKGALSSGSYMVECKKTYHSPTLKEITITPEMSGQTISLEAPIPITGSIDITSMPANAEITLDGKVIGTTPMFLPEYIIGPHTLKIAKAGYGTYNEEITLAEGETKTVSARLSNGRSIRITCATAGSRIYVDGQDMGAAPFEGTLSYGSHSVYAMNGAKKTAVKTVNVTEGTGAMADVSLSFMEKEIQVSVNGVTFEMVYVPGGTFTMGATAEQGSDADSDEKPTHRVTLSGYYIGKYEVTQAQWKAIMGNNPSSFEGDNLPVEFVSWDDCQEFIRKLNKLTGKKFSLPTEAQWEYAARGGKSGGTKYSGSNNIGNVAWYEDNSGDKTHPVGEKSPNDLGIYDMTGNVWEWCQDWYGDYSSYSQTNPTGPGSGSRRVNRGGSWYIIAMYCRVSNRNFNTPDDKYSYLGFRLCLSISEQL
ncbi:MAG: SUMF1/EgtB/PvdO family nonheme iron enzyme [Muribaculaceae bacterium]